MRSLARAPVRRSEPPSPTQLRILDQLLRSRTKPWRSYPDLSTSELNEHVWRALVRHGWAETYNLDVAGTTRTHEMLRITPAGEAVLTSSSGGVSERRQLEPLYRLNGVDGDVVTLTYREFHTDNWDMNPAELRAIGNLRPGETYRGGGGAAPEWSITRLHGDGSGGVSEPGLIYRYLVITKSDYDDIMRGKWTDNEDEYPESAWEGPFESEKLAREFVENEVGAPAVVVDLGVAGAGTWPEKMAAVLRKGKVLGRHTMGSGWAVVS